LRAYQQILDRISAAGARLVAISPETPDNSLTTQEKNQLGYDVLSDAGGEVERAFGLLFELPESLRAYYGRLGNDLRLRNGSSRWELPVPATYVIGRDGIVAAAAVDPDYRRRLEPDDLVAALEALGP
jgi:peroxiredoxin